MQSYIIRKFPAIGQKPKDIAKVHICDEGKLSYEMQVKDNDVEQVLLQAQEKGGLFCLVPFRKRNNGKILCGQRREFVKSTNHDHIADAIQYNLKSGIVDKE